MSDAPSQEPEEAGLPPGLRLLKWLVVALTLTMIGGVITVVALLVTRMPGVSTLPDIPPVLEMPADAVPQAITMGKGWIGVVTEDNRLLIFAPSGKLRQEITITP